MWLVERREVDLWAFYNKWPNSKGERPLQSVYMAAFFGTFGCQEFDLSEKSFGASKTEIQTLIERSNFFSIKYSESDKRTLI